MERKKRKNINRRGKKEQIEEGQRELSGSGIKRIVRVRYREDGEGQGQRELSGSEIERIVRVRVRGNCDG